MMAPPYSDHSGPGSLWKPMLASLTAHLLIMGVFLFWQPSDGSQQLSLPPVIKVRMVTMPQPSQAADRPRVKKQQPVKAAPAKKTARPDAVAIGKKKAVTRKPRIKSSLKRKTFKSRKVLKNAIKQLERKVETAPPDPLAQTLKRLRERVEQVKMPPKAGAAGGKKAAFSTSAPGGGRGKQVSDLLTVYRVEVAYQVQKNWAFAPQLAGNSKNLTTSVIFKVLPDGRITDITITDHSGNAYLDDSAQKAILKSSPVSPHPPGLNLPYVTIGLRFTPEGVR